MLGVVFLAGCMHQAANQENNDAMMSGDDTMMSGNLEANMSGEMMMEDDKMMEKEDDAMMKEDDSMMKEEGDDDKMMMESEMKYEAYNEAKVKEALTAGKKVALFFHASWCPSCRKLDKQLKSTMEAIPTNAVVFKVDYDSSTELKSQYGVTTQHTIVTIDKEMNMIDKKVGADLEAVVGMLQ